MARRNRAGLAAAIAAPVVVALALTWFSGLIFRVDYPTNPAISVAGQEEPSVDLAAVQRNWPDGVDGRFAHARLQGYMQQIETASVPAAAAPTAAAAVPQLDLATRLARADPARGRLATRACAACHSFDPEGRNGVGPALWGVVGRKMGGHPAYAYSKALASQPGDWTYEMLDDYLTSPAKALPGNKMAFPGIRNAQDRANVIAYLASLSRQPVPYPSPDAGKAGEQRPARG